MKPTLSYEMHTIYTGAIYLKAVMAFHNWQTNTCALMKPTLFLVKNKNKKTPKNKKQKRPNKDKNKKYKKKVNVISDFTNHKSLAPIHSI